MKGFHAKKPRRLLYFGTVAHLDWTLTRFAGVRYRNRFYRENTIPEAYRGVTRLSMLPPRDFERAVPTLLEYEGVILPYRWMS